MSDKKLLTGNEDLQLGFDKEPEPEIPAISNSRYRLEPNFTADESALKETRRRMEQEFAAMAARQVMGRGPIDANWDGRRPEHFNCRSELVDHQPEDEVTVFNVPYENPYSDSMEIRLEITFEGTKHALKSLVPRTILRSSSHKIKQVVEMEVERLCVNLNKIFG